MTDQSVTAGGGDCLCPGALPHPERGKHPGAAAEAHDERRRAADLRTGDRIIPGDLIGATDVQEVLGVYPFVDEDGARLVLVVYRDTYRPGVFITYFRAGLSIALAPAAEPDLPISITGDAPGAAIGRATVPEGGA